MDNEFDLLLLNSIQNFITEHDQIFKTEKVYGFAFYYAAEGSALSCVIGTYERLEKRVEEFIQSGYINIETNDTEGIMEWIKWFGPEEGWIGLDSNSFKDLNSFLLALIKTNKVKLFSDYLRKRITKNIKKIRSIVPNSDKIIFLFTHGFFNLELMHQIRRINSTDSYLKWHNEQHKTERLHDLIKKL